jgi:hypothetical protein
MVAPPGQNGWAIVNVGSAEKPVFAATRREEFHRLKKMIATTRCGQSAAWVRRGRLE